MKVNLFFWKEIINEVKDLQEWKLCQKFRRNDLYMMNIYVDDYKLIAV